MMKTIYKQLFTLVAALLLSISVPAQNLPALPGDPAVKQGVLPNGMKYYLSSNPSSKGRADFALVQKTGLYTVSDTSAPEVLELSRKYFDVYSFNNYGIQPNLANMDIIYKATKMPMIIGEYHFGTIHDFPWCSCRQQRICQGEG